MPQLKGRHWIFVSLWFLSLQQSREGQGCLETCPCLSSYISCYNMQCYLSCKPCLMFILPNFLNEYKPLSDVSYSYCWKCSAVNYQMQCPGKICQEVIQKWLWSTLASQMQKNKATKRAAFIVLSSLVLRHIWCISLIRDDSLPLAPPPSASRHLKEEKAAASHPFLLISLLLKVFSFDEDDRIREEDRGFPHPGWLRWPVTSCVQSLCVQLMSSFPQSVCCPRNVRRAGWLGKGISQCSRMRETFLTVQRMQQGD